MLSAWARCGAALGLAIVLSGAARAENAFADAAVGPGRKLAIGANIVGAQARLRFETPWAVEARYQHGTASSDGGDVTAHVLGLRGYRFFHLQDRFAPYLGAESAYLTASPAHSSDRASGFSFGGFGGVEIRVARELAFAVDAGPYLLSLHERAANRSDNSLDFVLNTALLWYVF